MGIREDEPWWTIAEIATTFRIDPKTVRRRIADGTLKATRVGPRLLRVDPASVLAAFGTATRAS